MKICFLINPETPPDKAENRRYLSAAARKLGHEASMASVDALALRDGKIMAGKKNLEAFDLIWVLSIGGRDGFLDKMQILKLLSQKTCVVNAPDALIHLHSKISMSGADGVQYPETHVSRDAAALWGIAQKSKARWVVKPVARSFGEGVALLKNRAQLSRLTENGKTCILMQRYIPEIERGEKRVLVAGGKIAGHYLRTATKEFRTNLHQGAEAAPCLLTREERKACERVAAYLLARGVHFAGLDVVWPYMLEWNVVSPGGIGTIHRLTDENIAANVLQNVLASSGFARKKAQGREHARASCSRRVR